MPAMQWEMHLTLTYKHDNIRLYCICDNVCMLVTTET